MSYRDPHPAHPTRGNLDRSHPLQWHLVATRNTGHTQDCEKHVLKCTDTPKLQLITQNFIFFRIGTVYPMSGSSQVGGLREAAVGTLRLHGDCGNESQDVWGPGRGMTKWTQTSIRRGSSGQASPPHSEIKFLCITRGLAHPEPGQMSLINHSASE